MRRAASAVLAVIAVALGMAGSASADGTLLGVGCHRGMVCIAVGWYLDHTTSRPLVEHLGRDVVRQRVPDPQNSIRSELNGISCPARAVCIAVGDSTDPNEHTVPLVERWNGRDWSAETIRPSPSPEASFLESVSCPTARRCTAVGVTNGAPLIEHWNGTDWASQAVPMPPGRSRPGLDSVSCSSATSCLAVGGYTDKEGHGQPLAERWNGSAWSITSAPYTDSRQSRQLIGVSCVAADWCTAVAGGVIQRWDGAGWSPQPSPHSHIHLQAVSCTAQTSCMAVGRYLSPGDDGTYAEVWNGRRWSTRRPESPSTEDELLSVSCSATNRCAAVGQGIPHPNALFTGLSEHWNGRNWSNVHWR